MEDTAPVRALIVTEFLPATDAGEITGGVEAYCHYVGRHMPPGLEWHAIADRSGRWTHASLLSVPRRLWFLAGALVAGLRASFDVVVGTTYVVHPLAWILGKVRRRPVVLWYPDVLLGTWRTAAGRLTGTVGEVMERLILRLPVDHYIAISESTAGKLVAHGVERRQVTVVPCGYDEAEVGAARSAPLAGAATATVVVVSRLVRYKRVDLVIEAFARVRAEVHDVDLVIVGQGPERDALEAQATSLGVAEQVSFTGFVPTHAEVLRRIAGATVLVSASEVEGFGIVLIEAMALGIPYIAADIDAYKEVTGGGVGGQLFSRGDSDQLTAALRRFLSDEQARAEAAAAGRSWAERYTWESVAHQTASTLTQVVNRARH